MSLQQPRDAESHELLPRAHSPSAGSSNGLGPIRRRGSSPSIAGSSSASPPHKARWLTPEFLVYFAWLAFCYFAGGSLVWDLSVTAQAERQEVGGNGAGTPWRHLVPGWMPGGRRVDLSDGQYRFFRAELPTLTLAAVVFLALSHGVRRWARNKLRARLYFYATFSLGFLLFTNGSATAFMLAIVGFNYLLSMLGAAGYTRACAASTWVFNCVILLLNERYNGYRWASLLGVGGLGGASWDSPLGRAASFLDAHRGVFGWHVLFNLVVLRMISFNMDRAWACAGRHVTDREGNVLTWEKHARKCADCTRIRADTMAASAAGAAAGASQEPDSASSTAVSPGEEGACLWWREKQPHAPSLYSPLSYFVYLFYVPLHFAGPTITFNAFLSQVAHGQRSYSPEQVVKYLLLKVAFVFLVLEWWLHHFYVFAYTGSSASYAALAPYQMAMVSYFALVAIWLKFTALWRFFRGWALVDGIEAPENMQRCVSNNYSIQSFWRAWHRSFNRWLVRYIYVPLGGGGGGAQAATATTTTAQQQQQALATSGAALITSPSLASPPPPSSPLPSSASSNSSSGGSWWLGVARQCFNVFVTFSFVAFWHDRTMQLLAWGWLIALLFVPELAARALVRHVPFLRAQRSKWYWRHVCACFAALSIFCMMVANLLGYSVGLGGVPVVLERVMVQGGVQMAVVVFAAFFAAAMIMFECRETGITVDS